MGKEDLVVDSVGVTEEEVVGGKEVAGTVEEMVEARAAVKVVKKVEEVDAAADLEECVAGKKVGAGRVASTVEAEQEEAKGVAKEAVAMVAILAED